MFAGEDYAGAHVEVVSPDGHERHDLSSWHCGDAPTVDYAWTPDSRLTCLSSPDPTSRLCVGTAPFTSCQAVAISPDIAISQAGLAWTPDGSSLLVAAWRSDGTIVQPDLFALSASGSTLEEVPFSARGGLSDPAFAPGQVCSRITWARLTPIRRTKSMIWLSVPSAATRRAR